MMRKGFTLIEILIVVAIIAILAGSLLIGYGPAQRQARDTRRITDLREVQTALELYYAKCGHYPGGLEGGSTCGAFASAPADWSTLTTNLIGSKLGINRVPNDPSGGKSYDYGSGDGSSYVLGALLEDENNPALQNSYKTSEDGVDCTGKNYCIKF